MTVPLSDARLTEIREVNSQWGGYAIDADRVSNTFAAVRELLGEVERLRDQLAERTDFLAEVNYQRERALGERDQARAELTEAREIASLASVFCIPRETGAPLQLRQIYDNTDRWAICDRTGKRWYRAEDGVAAAGWFYEPERESLCDLGRFTLAEALPLARQLAAAPTV